MKIVFNTLRTDAETIKVSFDGGNSWASVNTDDARTHGITFSFGEGAGYDCNDLSKIQIKGSFKTLTSKDIGAVAKAEKEDYQPNLQNKVVTVNGTVYADEGYDALGSVEVNVKAVPEYAAVVNNEITLFTGKSYDRVVYNPNLDCLPTTIQCKLKTEANNKYIGAFQYKPNIRVVVNDYADKPVVKAYKAAVEKAIETNTDYTWFISNATYNSTEGHVAFIPSFMHKFFNDTPYFYGYGKHETINRQYGFEIDYDSTSYYNENMIRGCSKDVYLNKNFDGMTLNYSIRYDNYYDTMTDIGNDWDFNTSEWYEDSEADYTLAICMDINFEDFFRSCESVRGFVPSTYNLYSYFGNLSSFSDALDYESFDDIKEYVKYGDIIIHTKVDLSKLNISARIPELLKHDIINSVNLDLGYFTVNNDMYFKGGCSLDKPEDSGDYYDVESYSLVLKSFYIDKNNITNISFNTSYDNFLIGAVVRSTPTKHYISDIFIQFKGIGEEAFDEEVFKSNTHHDDTYLSSVITSSLIGSNYIFGNIADLLPGALRKMVMDYYSRDYEPDTAIIFVNHFIIGLIETLFGKREFSNRSTVLSVSDIGGAVYRAEEYYIRYGNAIERFISDPTSEYLNNYIIVNCSYENDVVPPSFNSEETEEED